MTPESTLRFLPLDQLTVEPGHNPRTELGDVDELADSIRRHGVLSPIAVRPNPDTAEDAPPFVVVAGHRRLSAATLAGLSEIPALVHGDVDDARIKAIVENRHRSELNPVDEARAFAQQMKARKLSQKALAAELAVSPSLVSDRLALLKLPEGTQTLVAAGALTLDTVSTIRALPKGVPPTLVDAIAAKIGAGDLDPSHLADAPGSVLQEFAARRYGPLDCYFLHAGHSATLQDLRLPDELVEPLRDRVNAYQSDTGMLWFHLNAAEDIDRARSLGVLVTCKSTDGWGPDRHFYTDAAFVADLAAEQVKAAEAFRAKRRKEQAAAAAKAGAGTNGPDAGGPAPEEPVDKEAERRAARLAVEAADRSNVNLGVRVAQLYTDPAVSLEAAKLVALLALSQLGTETIGAGPRVTRDDFRTVTRTELKTRPGEYKLTFQIKSAAEVHQALRDEILAATTPERAIGVVVRASIEAAYATQQHLPTSLKSFGGSFNGYASSDTSRHLYALVGTLAKPVLTDETREQAAKGHTYWGEAPVLLGLREANDQQRAAALRGEDPDQVHATFTARCRVTPDDDTQPAEEHEFSGRVSFPEGSDTDLIADSVLDAIWAGIDDPAAFASQLEIIELSLTDAEPSGEAVDPQYPAPEATTVVEPPSVEEVAA